MYEDCNWLTEEERRIQQEEDEAWDYACAAAAYYDEMDGIAEKADAEAAADGSSVGAVT